LAVSFGAAGLPHLAAAQEGGLTARLGLSSGLLFQDDSTSGDDIEASTGFTFGLRSVTDAHSFDASTGGRFLWRDGELDFDNRAVDLSYAFATRRTEIGLTLGYREQDVTAGTLIDALIVDEDGEIVDVSLVTDEGTRQSLTAQLSVETGIDGPFGTETSLRFSRVDYQGLITNSLNDSETIDLRTALRFEIDPLVTLRLTGRFSELDEADTVNTLRTTTEAGASLTARIDPLWTASAGLRFSRIETETDDGFGGRTVAIRDGGGFDIGLTRAFRTGELRASAQRELTTIGTRDRYALSGSMELARGGEVGGALSWIVFESGETAPALSLSYAQPTRHGGFDLSLQQSAQIRNSNEAIRTALSASYRHGLSRTQSLTLDGSLVAQDVLGTDVGDQELYEIGLGYNHALTAEWDLAARVEHRQIFETGAVDREINTLSLTLERQFSFRP
jgi:hypothetical protein